MSTPRKLVSTLFIHQLLLALLPLAAIGTLIYGVLSNDVERRAHANMAVLATAVAEQVGEFLQSPRVVMTSLDLQIQTFAGRDVDLKRYVMDTLIERTGVFEVLYLLSGNDFVTAVGLPEDRRSFRDDYENVKGGRQEFIQAARAEGRIHWSDTFLSVLNSTTSVGLAMPLEFGEVLVGHVSIEKLSRYVATLDVGLNTLALITDKNGQIIAHENVAIANQQLNISNQALIAAAIEGQQQSGPLQLNGVDYIASTHLIQDVGWIVVTAQPRMVVLNDIHHTLWILALGALLAASLAVVISRWMAHKLAAPIVSFSEATSQVRRGNFQLKFPPSRLHEVSVLADNFEEMAQELMRKQLSLQSSQQTYRDLVDQVPCIICRTRAKTDGQVELIGKPIERLSGFLPDDFLARGGMTIDSLLHPADRNRRNTIINQRVSVNQPWGIEYRLMHRDGSERWVIEEGRATYDASLQATHFDLMLIDNTQRKQAERNQQEQAELMLTLLDTVPSPIFYQNRYGELLGCNQAFEQFFYLDQSRLIGRGYLSLEREFPELGALLHPPELLLSQHRELTEEQALTIGGSERHVVLKRASFVDAEGRISGLIGVVYDLTERVQAEAQNQQLHNYYTNVVDVMPSILIGISATNEIDLINREGRNRLRQVGGGTDAGYRMLLQQFDLDESWIEHCIAQQQVDLIRRRPCLGGSRYEDITIYPLDPTVGGGAVIRIDDVTDQVRMEELLVQSEKMLSVGGLAAGMAHEINNPLAGILQNAQVLRNRIDLKLPANQRAADECQVSLEQVRCYLDKRAIPAMLDAIDESGHRAARIVENMLSFARKSDSDFIPTDVTELIEQTLELTLNDYDLKKNYDFRNVSLVREYQPVAPIRCAPSKLQQVFFNLIKNSAQAMAVKTRMGQAPQLTLRLCQQDQWLRIEIEDNGPGIDEATAKRVFEPFFTTKEVGVGTGLGLSVSYFIVTENHHGRMRVESRPESGACFVIELPLETEPEVQYE